LEDRIVRQWKIPPTLLSIDSGQVHVWRIRLDLNNPDQTKFLSILSKNEVEKAEKFHFEADRIRYLVIRGALRVLLGKYGGEDPGSLEIAYSHSGKPYLSNKGNIKNILFNTSHAGEIGLIAVAVDRQVGVDLELIRQDKSIKSISKRFFTPEETAQLLALPELLQQEGFFTCWTRKEAFVKASGEGLSIPLNQFQVSFYPNDTPRLLSVRKETGEAGRWSMFHLDPGTNYVGALVVEGKNLNVLG
jgi:4'-phosphopantetheinyl transferase